MDITITYGMGPASIATDLKEKNPDGTTPPITKQDVANANNILNNFYKSFPTVKKWKDETEKNAKITGYVEDMWGRRRRLPDLFLPKYEFRLKNKPFTLTNFNPLLGSTGKARNVKPPIITKYEEALDKARNYNDREAIKKQALKEGVTIIDHGAHISTAERQCVNARIQGSAASMSKIALRKVYDNQELRDLGFKILLQIHDEFIGECPKENAERCAELLSLIMRTSVEDVVSVPFKCDVEQTGRWYEDEYFSNLRNNYHKLLDKGVSVEDAQKKIREDNPESIIYDINELLDIKC